jgi:hypothetical protein
MSTIEHFILWHTTGWSSYANTERLLLSIKYPARIKDFDAHFMVLDVGDIQVTIPPILKVIDEVLMNSETQVTVYLHRSARCNLHSMIEVQYEEVV